MSIDLSKSIDWPDKAGQLRRNDYCIIPDLLIKVFASQLREAANKLGDNVGNALRSQSSMVGVPDLSDPVFGQLIASDCILKPCAQTLADCRRKTKLGFARSRDPEKSR